MSDGSQRHWADADQLQAFREGSLPESVRQQRIRHLAECSDCREALARADDGLQVEPTPEEHRAYEEQRMLSDDRNFSEVVRRARDEVPGHAARRAGAGNMGLGDWLRRHWLVPTAVGTCAIALAVLLLPGSPPSRRAELDALYARAGRIYPPWAGSPGRLVQPFTPSLRAPFRGANEVPHDESASLQAVEDSLLSLKIPDAAERRERDVAVASLRLARGEAESAWRILEPHASEHATPQSLSALACAAIASGDPAHLRRAAEVLMNAKSTDPAVLYDRVLLRHLLGEDEVASRLLEQYLRLAGARGPWAAQLEAIVDPSTTAPESSASEF